MSDSPSHGDDALTDITTTKTDDIQAEEMNGSVELHIHATSTVMGDIGNPPHGNFTQNSEEKGEKAKSSPSLPSPKLSIVIDDMEKDEEEVIIGAIQPVSNPPPTNDIHDGESVEEPGSESSSTLESSPAPMKRSFVLSGREHEDTDDFLLSTMLAIRTAVLAGTRDASKLAATPEDFCASRKHKISMAGDRKVEVKDYAPVVFTLIRRMFGVSIPAYLLSWSDSRLAKSKSVGKSDSMFIHSPDHKFVLKTLAREEAKRLCKILRPYYEHLSTNKDTFMSRIYGLHRMSRRRGQSNIYFAIFNNVFDSGHPLSEIYDLKGSTVGRRASCEQPAQRRSSTSFEFRQIRKAISDEQAQPPKKPPVLKDLDFTRKLHVGPENRAKVLLQLQRDCKFLASHQLMDYSLLIGVRRTDTPNGTSPSPSSPSSSPDSPTPSRNANNTTAPLSPTSDQRVLPIKNGFPIIPPSSPRARHSIVGPSSIPASQRERVPGLLFFLESSKAATSKSLRETKRDRRKSVSEGAGNALLQQELRAIEEEEDDLKQSTDVTQPPTEEQNPIDSPKPATEETNKTNETNKPEKTKSGSTESTPSHTPQNTPPKISAPIHTPEPSLVIEQQPTSRPLNGILKTSSSERLQKAKKIEEASQKVEETSQKVEETSSPRIMITVEPPDDDEEDETEGTPPEINIIPPPSPIVSHQKSSSNGSNGNSGNSGNIGEVEENNHSPAVPSLKFAAIEKPANGSDEENKVADDESDDSSLMDSPNDSPRQSLGMLTVNSVPSFDYFANTPPQGVPLSKSGSSTLTAASPGTPTLMKRNTRSASLTYVNLDPLCGSPYVPFYKEAEGGIPGATFVPLDPNKSNEIYYIGLIDFLQKYNKKKKLAGFAKSFKYEKEELSTVDPVFYMERFIKMTEKSIVE